MIVHGPGRVAEPSTGKHQHKVFCIACASGSRRDDKLCTSGSLLVLSRKTTVHSSISVLHHLMQRYPGKASQALHHHTFKIALLLQLLGQAGWTQQVASLVCQCAWIIEAPANSGILAQRLALASQTGPRSFTSRGTVVQGIAIAARPALFFGVWAPLALKPANFTDLYAGGVLTCFWTSALGILSGLLAPMTLGVVVVLIIVLVIALPLSATTPAFAWTGSAGASYLSGEGHS